MTPFLLFSGNNQRAHRVLVGENDGVRSLGSGHRTSSASKGKENDDFQNHSSSVAFPLAHRRRSHAGEIHNGRSQSDVSREDSLMLCAILRGQGVPARTRCGFGTHFTPGKFEDHWVCEYWNAGQSRWILVDAQLDAVQRNLLRPDFDPLDVPGDRFIIAGDAWRMCRTGRKEADRFGLSFMPGLSGMWFIAGNLLRDLASLNRMELLPWDVWGLMQMTDAGLLEEKGALLDRIAALTLAGDSAFAEVREIYEDDRLRVPPAVFNALRNAPETIEGSPS
jgi:hypothetical protein